NLVLESASGVQKSFRWVLPGLRPDAPGWDLSVPGICTQPPAPSRQHPLPPGGGFVGPVVRPHRLRDLTRRTHLNRGRLPLVVDVEQVTLPLLGTRRIAGDAMLHSQGLLVQVTDRSEEAHAGTVGQRDWRPRQGRRLRARSPPRLERLLQVRPV